jgi:hypothetical protein
VSLWQTFGIFERPVVRMEQTCSVDEMLCLSTCKRGFYFTGHEHKASDPSQCWMQQIWKFKQQHTDSSLLYCSAERSELRTLRRTAPCRNLRSPWHNYTSVCRNEGHVRPSVPSLESDLKLLIDLYLVLYYWYANAYILPNVVVELLTLLLRIREVRGSISGPEIGYPDWGILWFSLVLLGELLESALNCPRPLLPNIFSAPFHLTLFLLMLYKIILVTEKRC